MAGALLPHGPPGPAAPRPTVTKRQTLDRYRDVVGGPWADYLDALYANAKLRWGYLVPPDPAARRELRSLCAPTLAFERHFLAQYRIFFSVLADSPEGEACRYAKESLAAVAWERSGPG